MSTEALDIYKDTLIEQLGEDSPVTEPGIIDPDGEALEVFGVFDDNVFKGAKGGGNITPKKSGPRFIVAELPEGIDIYSDVNIYFSYRDKTYKIQYIEPDKQGAQVIWLV